MRLWVLCTFLAWLLLGLAIEAAPALSDLILPDPFLSAGVASARALPAPALPGGVDKVVLLVIDRLAVEDITGDPAAMPALRALGERGGIALLNVRTDAQADPGNGYLTIGAGVRSEAGSWAGLAFHVDERYRGVPAGEFYRSLTEGPTGPPERDLPGSGPPAPGSPEPGRRSPGLSGLPEPGSSDPGLPARSGLLEPEPLVPEPLVGIVHLGIGEARRIAASADRSYVPGALGELLRKSGKRVSVFGNGDALGEERRYAALIAMDAAGRVPEGNVGGDVVAEDPGWPGVERTDYERLLVLVVDALGRDDLVVVDLADLARLEEWEDFIDPGRFAEARKEALGRIDGFVEALVGVLEGALREEIARPAGSAGTPAGAAGDERAGGTAAGSARSAGGIAWNAGPYTAATASVATASAAVSESVEEGDGAGAVALLVVSPSPAKKAAEQGVLLTPLIASVVTGSGGKGEAGSGVRRGTGDGTGGGDGGGDGGGNEGFAPTGLLMSLSTKRPGLAMNIDVAPTIAGALGVADDGGLFDGGSLVLGRKVDRPWEWLAREYERIAAVHTQRISVIQPFFFAQMAIMLGGAVLIWAIARRFVLWTPRLGRAWRFLLLTSFSFPLALLVLSPLPPAPLWAVWVRIAVAVVVIAGVAFWVGRDDVASAGGLAGAAVAALLIDIALGEPLMGDSLLGYSPISGSRFYGIGNEYMGFLIGSTLIAAGAVLDKARAAERARVGEGERGGEQVGWRKWDGGPGGATADASADVRADASADAPADPLTGGSPEAPNDAPADASTGAPAGQSVEPPSGAPASSKAFRRAFAGVVALFLLVTVFLALPRLGINVGGTITAIVGFAYYLMALSGRRFTLARAVLVGVLVVAAIAVMALIDGQLGDGSSHLGQTVQKVGQAGTDPLWNTFERKVSVNMRLIRLTIWSRVVMLSFGVLALFVFYPSKLMSEVRRRNPFLSLSLRAAFVAALTTLVVNDSGIVAAATLLLPATLVTLLLLPPVTSDLAGRSTG